MLRLPILTSVGCLAVALLAGRQAAAQAGAYVGSEKCRQCHEFEYQVWERSAHRRAQQALTEAQRGDAKCNTCHTMSAETTNTDTPVGCERCHGPGKYYTPSFVMKDRELARAVGLVDAKPEHCVQCHTEGTPSIRPFKFDEMWAKIDHGKAAREAWEKARREAAKPVTRAETKAQPAAVKADTKAKPPTKAKK